MPRGLFGLLTVPFTLALVMTREAAMKVLKKKVFTTDIILKSVKEASRKGLTVSEKIVEATAKEVLSKAILSKRAMTAKEQDLTQRRSFFLTSEETAAINTPRPALKSLVGMF
jgi:hypothetical protein